jgi:hypothetical protein
MRDYTKSGMTIPHKVQTAVLKGFFARRPELGKKGARFFAEQQLFVNDGGGSYDMTRPLSGSPLGLFVEGYTLLQYAIHEMNLNSGVLPRSMFTFSATNDDMVVGCKDHDTLISYQDIDIRTNSELCMAYKDTKSGISINRFVFCEEYWVDDHVEDKSCLYSTAIITAKHAYSPFHAKEYVYSVLSSAQVITPEIEAAVREVQSTVGYEFHEDEWNWPFLFGGWLPCIKSGLDHSIEWYNGDLRAIAGYWASRERLRKYGSLDESPHLALGRKYGIRLLSEAKDIPNWVDLIPLLGSRRSIERHFRQAHAHPKAILKDYLKLGRIRLEKYNSIMAGSVDVPSPTHEWVLRHPNTYWMDVMPGIESAEPFTTLHSPRYGMKNNNQFMKLLYLRSLGHIDMEGSAPISKTTIEMAKLGITEHCHLNHLRLSKRGISTKILALQPPGLYDWSLRTDKVPISICDGDSPLQATELWCFMPASSLLTAMRSISYLKDSIKGEPLNDMHYLWMANTINQIGKEEAQGVFATDRDESSNEAQFSALLAAKIRDVIRDWVPDADGVIEAMRDRIIALPNQDSAEVAHARMLLEDDDPFTLRPRGSEEVGFNASAADDDQSSDVFNPWDELGVT